METLVEKKWEDVVHRGTTGRSSLNFLIEDWEMRDRFRHSVSWHIPTTDLVELIKSYSPVVSVGSGLAYTESIALEKGADILATDISPDEKNLWCTDGEFQMEVEKLDASGAVKKYFDRNVFMGWPPYDNPMAYEVVKAMEIGKFLVYVGEGHGGCTGNDEFFEYLYANFEEVEIEFSIPRWSGIYDGVQVFKKVKNE
jgi:hypothetical protein